LLDGVNVRVVTDPPYGIEHDTDYTRFTGGIHDSRNFDAPIEGDDEEFDPSHLLGYEECILWGANCYSTHLPLGSWLVWDKRNDEGEKLMSDGEVAWQSGGHGVYIFEHTWNGFDRDSERGETLHPTQKPVALFGWCISRLRTDGPIFDPYCGSAPSIIAAEQEGRTCYAMEIDPAYCAVILERCSEAGMDCELISS